MPPLANSGLCLSVGALDAAWGSFLLFFTNFVSILLASSAIFVLAGMVEGSWTRQKLALAKRFGFFLAGFLIVAFFLTLELGHLLEDRRVRNVVRTVLEEELPRYRVTKLEQLRIRRRGKVLSVLAQVLAPRIPSPLHVRATEDELERRLEMPVELYVQSTMTHNVSAAGSIRRNLDDEFRAFGRLRRRPVETASSDELLALSEQIIREYVADKLGIRLVGLDTFTWPPTTVLIAEISGFRSLRQSEILELEQRIEARSAKKVRLGVTYLNDGVHDSTGRIRTELSARRPPSEQERVLGEKLRKLVAKVLGEDRLHVTGDSLLQLGGKTIALYEVVGPKLASPEDVEALRARAERELGVSIELYVRSVLDTVAGTGGYESLDSLLDRFGVQTRAAFEKETRTIQDSWR